MTMLDDPVKRLERLLEEREAMVAEHAALVVAHENVLSANRVLQHDLDLARSRELHLIDAVKLFAERCDAKPEEIAQLGVGTLVKSDPDKPAEIVWNTLDDLVTASAFAMKAQATVAKFRQLKEHFVTHQRAVSTMLDALDRLGRKNVVTKTDLDALRRLRADLAALIRRAV